VLHHLFTHYEIISRANKRKAMHRGGPSRTGRGPAPASRTTERDFGEAKKRNNFKKVAKETGHHPERAVTRLGSY